MQLLIMQESLLKDLLLEMMEAHKGTIIKILYASALAGDYDKYGRSVNCVASGPTNTSMFSEYKGSI